MGLVLKETGWCSPHHGLRQIAAVERSVSGDVQRAFRKTGGMVCHPAKKPNVSLQECNPTRRDNIDSLERMLWHLCHACSLHPIHRYMRVSLRGTACDHVSELKLQIKILNTLQII